MYRQGLNMLYCALFLAMLTSACTNPFTTRDPEPPVSGRLTWIPPRTPEVVLQNIQNAIAELNAENYLRSLSDSSKHPLRYTFLPDPAVASENPGVFEGWDRSNERVYFGQVRVATPADSVHFLALETVQKTLYADSALFVVNYTLMVHHRQQSQGIPAVFSGRARFWIGSDTFGDWAIYRWEDLSSGNTPSWSVLKAAYGK